MYQFRVVNRRQTSKDRVHDSKGLGLSKVFHLLNPANKRPASDELKFEVWREGCLGNDHCFDAVLCAYTGYLWATERWELPQQHRDIFDQDGWIWFPAPRRQPR